MSSVTESWAQLLWPTFFPKWPLLSNTKTESWATFWEMIVHAGRDPWNLLWINFLLYHRAVDVCATCSRLLLAPEHSSAGMLMNWWMDVGGLQGCYYNLFWGSGSQVFVTDTAHHQLLITPHFLFKWQVVRVQQKCTVSHHSERDFLDLSAGLARSELVYVYMYEFMHVYIVCAIYVCIHSFTPLLYSTCHFSKVHRL